MSLYFTIRSAEPQDRPVLVKLMELLQDTESDLHPNRSSGSQIGNEHFAYLEEIVKKQNGQIYVAQSKESIIGFLVCFVEELDEGDLHIVERERKYGYISDLYVLETMREAGVGAALMKAAENWFLDLKLEVVRVSLLCSNEKAAKFYRKAGYQPYEIVYEKQLQKERFVSGETDRT
ncbi:GNAT family N-acetyltransferase [Scytonema sp. UIC 10036]|uniref:GNAT family N-acetyltransferase n=1 Tax=Scytonema sp. UIC 10036 TaxID=2304196 RepID=UPI0012DAA801|nr:GNAT family N-acetyltransferase [Scytonema sp. UIC 10036]MUG95172.1 GNAT family N-acetyltransferase [Scytonema sp. UIC 10036]